jgi:hypothetical protein
MVHARILASLAAAATLAGCASMTSPAPQSRVAGWQMPLGKGSAATYVEFADGNTPASIGVALSAQALDELPQGSDMHRCHGRTQEGNVDAATKCVQTFEHVIPLPDAVARRADVPFKWVLLNWNPHGHIPPGVYDVPHFDIHFMMVPISDIFAIEPGPCGPEMVRCDQFRIGKKPLPANYMHADFRDVDAVVPAMGNHLIDLTGPEFNKQPFTHSWIYGVYDGKVTFYEQMITRAYLLGNPDGCTPIKSPPAVAVSGFYPRVACIRHDAKSGDYTVSMEQFTFREASAPAAMSAAK